MWPSYPLPFRFFFFFLVPLAGKHLQPEMTLSAIWLARDFIGSWPERLSLTFEGPWPWLDSRASCIHIFRAGAAGVWLCLLFFFCWVSWSEIVWFIDNFQKGGMELREQSKFWHWVLSAGIQIYWWANRKHGQYGYRKRSLVVVVIAAAPFPIPIRFHSVVSAFFQIPRHICCSILIKNAWNVYPYI